MLSEQQNKGLFHCVVDHMAFVYEDNGV